jgi:nucleolar MIF4G domain-containing protein 1
LTYFEQERQRKRHLLAANRAEDKTIKKLEKQLRLNKRKTKALPASFKEDGLDFLLDVLEPEGLGNLDSDDDLETVNKSGVNDMMTNFG